MRTARRRLLMAALVEAAGRGLAWGAGAALAGVLVSRLVTVPAPMAVLIGGPLLVGTAAGVVNGLRRQRTALGAASVVDQRLGLKDRISTATALGSLARRDGGFAGLALEEAETASLGVDVRRAAPIRFGRAWWVWPVAAGATVAIGLFVPEYDLLGRASAAERAAEAARERVRAQLADAGTRTASPAEPEMRQGEPGVAAESQRVLEEIRKELDSGASTPQGAAERAARELDTLAKDREQAAAAVERRRDAVAEAMGDVRKAEADGTSADRSEIARALRSGDFAEASRAAKDLLNTDKGLNAKDRERAAQELARLAEQLRAAARASEDARNARERTDSGARESRSGEPTRTETMDSEGARRPNAVPAQTQPAEDLAKSLERAAEAIRDDTPNQPSVRPESSERREQRRPTSPTSDRPKIPDRNEKPAGSEAPPGENKPREPGDRASNSDSAGEPSDPDRPAPTQQEKGDQAKEGESREGRQPGAGQRAEPSESTEPKAGEATRGEQTPKDQGDKQQAPTTDPKAESKNQSPKSAERKPSESGPKQSEGEKIGERDNPGETGSSGAPRKDGELRGHGPSESPAGSPRTGSKPDPSRTGEAVRRDSLERSRPSSDGQEEGPRSKPAPGDSPAGESGASRPEGLERESGTTPGEPRPDAREQHRPGEGGNRPDASAPRGLPESLPEPSREDITRLADELQKLADAPKNAAARRQEAQRYRRQAEDLLRSASPEQRETLERWGRDLAEEMRNRGQDARDNLKDAGHGPGGRAGDPLGRSTDGPAADRTDVVDARSRPSPNAKPRERVIAEWYSDRPADGASTDPLPALSPEGQSLAREAVREGERALDSQIVPSRFDRLLQRYFQRLPQRAGAPSGGETEAKPAEPAADAPGKGSP
ncbi:MAG TPA: hypothetical protein PKE29_08505 [Phycisphaerales bacterium]|nr:hypothetical protein [Phycisphaerales bacterium]